MVLKTSSLGLSGLVLLAALVVGLSPAEGATPLMASHQAPPIFQNYYVPPGPCGGVGAQLYVSPRPVPERVGHTWITYQPLMPHEYLYPHCRTYYTRHDDARRTKTKVHYRHAVLPDFTPTYVNGRILSNLFDH